MKRVNLILCFIFLWGVSYSENPKQVPNPRKQNNGWVSDHANVISDKDELEINRVLDELERETGVEMAVVTIQSAGDFTPKDFATELFNLWGIGKKEKDNGVLMLLVMDARRVEVETGYGVEGALPDAVVGSLLREKAVPEFREGRYGTGLKRVTQEMARALRMNPEVFTKPRIRPSTPSAGMFGDDNPRRPVPSAQSPILQPPGSSYLPVKSSPNGNRDYTPIAIPAAIAVLVIGGGALVYLLARQPSCPTCSVNLRRLSEDQDDAYLNPIQQLEERLGGVDYQAWRCDMCQYLVINRIKRWMSDYKDCPRCNNATLRVNRYTVQEPTYTRSGLEQTDYTCVTPGCRYKNQKSRTLPRRQRANEWDFTGGGIWSSGSSGSRSGGSGWSGDGSSGGWSGGDSSGGWSGGSSSGGWSGGSPSSSDSSGGSFGGGSFGGGSSGGGGAGASW